MPKRTKLMTEEEVVAAANRLSESREHLVTQMVNLCDLFQDFNKRLHAFEEFLDTRDELLAARMTLHNSVMDVIGGLKDVLTENTVALNENTDRLDKFLTKFETYFSTDRGLEFEN